MNGQPELLAEWLDRVPLEGPVTRALAESVLKGLTSLHGVGLGVASRLLAVKRPDRFVTLNNANKDRVRDLWGHAPATASAYLDWHEDLWALAWCLAPPPDDRYEHQAWEARIALLDALIYQPPE